MNTKQLLEKLYKDKHSQKYFDGVLPIDRLLEQNIKKPQSYILNTKKSDSPGQNWFALFIPQNAKIEYFDSFGLKPINNELYIFIEKNSNKFIWNNKVIQRIISKNCGQYCVFNLFLRSSNFNMKKIIKFFNTNKKNND